MSEQEKQVFTAPACVEISTHDAVRIERLLDAANNQMLVDLGPLMGGPVWLVYDYKTQNRKGFAPHGVFTLGEVKPIQFGKPQRCATFDCACVGQCQGKRL